MIGNKSLDQINSNPLSKAVKALLKSPDNGKLHLEQFFLEQMDEVMSKRTTKYWMFVLEKAKNYLEAPTNRSPQFRYNLFTVNQNHEQKDDQEWNLSEMLKQAKNKESDLLMESLLDNLTSNLNLEPEFPELL